jgi:hypothetical protein
MGGAVALDHVTRQGRAREGNSGLVELGSLLGKIGQFHGIPTQVCIAAARAGFSQFGRGAGILVDPELLHNVR